MKKSPIKVVVRLRPTSNFAHQQMTVDEQTGYLSCLNQKHFDSRLATIRSRHRKSSAKSMGLSIRESPLERIPGSYLQS